MGSLFGVGCWQLQPRYLRSLFRCYTWQDRNAYESSSLLVATCVMLVLGSPLVYFANDHRVGPYNPVWEQVWLSGLEHVNNWTLTSHFMLITPSPSNMSAWYPLRLEPWQLTLKYLNSATELPSDSVAQLVRAWQAICQDMGSSSSLSHCHFLFRSFFLFISFILTDFDLG